MGLYTQPPQAKLIIGILAKNEDFLNSARKKLSIIFGPEEEVLAPIPFTWTNYYENELGTAPIRFFASYQELIDRESIVDVKRLSNDLENYMRVDNLRPVNLDPGYLTLGQFFLATTKDQRQRVFLRKGIFIEPTLFFKDGAFHHFDWTYWDYRSDIYLEYFKKARSKLAFQLKNGRPYSQRKSQVD